MYYVAGVQSYGTVIEIEKNEGFAHLYLHAQGHKALMQPPEPKDRYRIGYMETRTGSANTVSTVMHKDLRVANAPDWEDLRQDKYGVDPGNITAYVNPIYTNCFPSLKFAVNEDFEEDDMLRCTFTSTIAT